MSLDADTVREVSSEHADAYRAIMLSTPFRRIVVRELLMMTHTWGPPPALASIPLTVLTATEQPGSVKPVWTQMQDELAALSPDSKHVMAEQALYPPGQPGPGHPGDPRSRQSLPGGIAPPEALSSAL